MKPGYERKGKDVYSTVQIPFTTAVLGGETIVQTLTGKVMCKIAPGTQSGTKIRLRGKGIVSMKDKNIRGDQYITVRIQVPKNLSEDAKRKLKAFEEACEKKGRGAAKVPFSFFVACIVDGLSFALYNKRVEKNTLSVWKCVNDIA